MIELPDPKSSSAVADWIELHLATSADAISKLELFSIVEHASGKEPSENFINNIWIELLNRQERYCNPLFRVFDKRVESKENAGSNIEYIVCLILSLFGVPEEFQNGPKLFERLSAEVIKRYLNGEVFIFGWPPLEDTPSSIAERVKSACDCLQENFVESPAARYNDRGVDLISWIPFLDSRSSQCVILAQCASGTNWKEHAPLPMKSWEQYIHWACNPIEAFFVPCIVPDKLWHDVSKDNGVLFDRIRIMNLLGAGIEDQQLRDELRDWEEQQLQEATI